MSIGSISSGDGCDIYRLSGASSGLFKITYAVAAAAARCGILASEAAKPLIFGVDAPSSFALPAEDLSSPD